MNFERGQDPKHAMGIGRGKYSRKEFEGYRYRASVEIYYYKDNALQHTLINVYTNQVNKEKAETEIHSRLNDHVVKALIVNWASKEQDDLALEFIEEIL